MNDAAAEPVPRDEPAAGFAPSRHQARGGHFSLLPSGSALCRPSTAFYAAVWRSRRNWKNSTPSRKRRFIICGLRTISPTMEAIFGARK